MARYFKIVLKVMKRPRSVGSDGRYHTIPPIHKCFNGRDSFTINQRSLSLARQAGARALIQIEVPEKKRLLAGFRSLGRQRQTRLPSLAVVVVDQNGKSDAPAW